MKFSDTENEYEESFDSPVFFVASPQSFVPKSFIPPTNLAVDPPLVVNWRLLAPNPNHLATLQPRLSGDSGVDPDESPEESVFGFRAPEDRPEFTKIPDYGLVLDVLVALENDPVRTTSGLKDDGKCDFPEERCILAVPLYPCCLEETSIEIDSSPIAVDDLHSKSALETAPKLAEDSLSGFLNFLLNCFC